MAEDTGISVDSSTDDGSEDEPENEGIGMFRDGFVETYDAWSLGDNPGVSGEGKASDGSDSSAN